MQPGSTLSITVAAGRPRLVLDTSVVLSDYGPMLARLLGGHAEVWITRELWHLLDNLDVYRDGADESWNEDAPGSTDGPTRRALHTWDRLRRVKDLGGLACHWVADSVAASLLPPGQDVALVARFEALTAALQRRSARARPKTPGRAIGAGGARDVAALAAALGDATVLCLRRTPLASAADAQRELPALVRELAHFRLPALNVSDDDPLVQISRAHLVTLLERAGASVALWSGLALQAVRVAAPRTEGLLAPVRGDGDALAESYDEALAGALGATPANLPDPAWWDGARVLWFDVYAGPQGLSQQLALAEAAAPRARRSVRG